MHVRCIRELRPHIRVLDQFDSLSNLSAPRASNEHCSVQASESQEVGSLSGLSKPVAWLRPHSLPLLHLPPPPFVLTTGESCLGNLCLPLPPTPLLLVIRSRVRRTVSSLAPPRHRRNSVYMWICGYIESAACRKSHTPYKLDKFLEIWRDVKSYNRIRKMELSQESNNEPEEDGG
jgi:hypothetical protein